MQFERAYLARRLLPACQLTQELCQELPDDCTPDPAAAAPAAGLLPPHGGAVSGWCWLVTSGLHATVSPMWRLEWHWRLPGPGPRVPSSLTSQPHTASSLPSLLPAHTQRAFHFRRLDVTLN